MRMPSRPLLLAGLGVAVIVLAALSLSAGRVWVPFSAWFSGADDPQWIILFDLRLPRTILGIAVGMALGLSGAALQGYARNPLADPGVLGVSSMAALGAVMTLYLGAAMTLPWLLPVGAMIGALIGIALLLLLSGATSSILSFVLAGMILNTVSSAGVALALNLSPDPWPTAALTMCAWRFPLSPWAVPCCSQSAGLLMP